MRSLFVAIIAISFFTNAHAGTSNASLVGFSVSPLVGGKIAISNNASTTILAALSISRGYGEYQSGSYDPIDFRFSIVYLHPNGYTETILKTETAVTTSSFKSDLGLVDIPFNLTIPAGLVGGKVIVKYRWYKWNSTNGQYNTWVPSSGTTTSSVSYQTFTTTYGNQAKTVAFVKDDCPTGVNGSLVNYTVPANKYSSAISQADADAKAQAEINANGQAYANANGNCMVFGSDINPGDDELGGRPLIEFSDRCIGFQTLQASYVNEEVFGFITMDNKIIVTRILPYSGGTNYFLYKDSNGDLYYPYPKGQGAPTGTYTYAKENSDYYFIRVKASFHTYSPCHQNGTDGVSKPVDYQEKVFAGKYHISHWIVGCGAVAKYNTDSEYFDIQYGSPSTYCESIY